MKIFDPHRDPHAEMSVKGQRAPDRKFCLPVWLFVAFSALHDLRHKIPHRLRRPVLLLSGGVGVGAEGEACVVVAQHTGNRLDVHAVLERQCCEGMPLWHNKDKSENPCVATGWLVCPYSFSTKNGPQTGSTGGGEKPGLHLKDKFFRTVKEVKNGSLGH